MVKRGGRPRAHGFGGKERGLLRYLGIFGSKACDCSFIALRTVGKVSVYSRCTVGILSDFGWRDIRDLRDESDRNRRREVGWLGAGSSWLYGEKLPAIRREIQKAGTFLKKCRTFLKKSRLFPEKCRHFQLRSVGRSISPCGAGNCVPYDRHFP